MIPDFTFLFGLPDTLLNMPVEDQSASFKRQAKRCWILFQELLFKCGPRTKSPSAAQPTLQTALASDDGTANKDRHEELVQVRDQIARFNTWGANIGVYASERASLDYRLRDSKDVRIMVLGVLESLEHKISRGTPYSQL